METESRITLNLMRDPFVQRLPDVLPNQPIFSQPKRIFVGGDNNGRVAYLESSFPVTKVQSIMYKPSEPRDPDEGVVARHKITEVLGAYGEIGGEKIMTGDLIVGSDTRTHILTTNNGQTSQYESVGKPKKTEEVRIVFEKLYSAVQRGFVPVYKIQAASGFSYMDEQEKLLFQETEEVVEVQLRQKILEQLATHRFEEYLEEMNVLFKEKDAFKYKAAGLSIEVLMKMGAIEAINNQSVDEVLKNERNLRSIIRSAAIGTSPKLLQYFEGVDFDGGLGINLINEAIAYLSQ